jgi:hypothetical protein
MFCITPQMACQQGKRAAVTRKTTVYIPGYTIRLSCMKLVPTNSCTIYRCHNIVLEVAVLWSCQPQSLLSAFDLIALWRRRVIESSRCSQTQTVVNQGPERAMPIHIAASHANRSVSAWQNGPARRRRLTSSKALYTIDLA